MRADRRTIAIAATGLVVVALVLVVVFASFVPIPEFAPLADADLTGYVAYGVETSDDGDLGTAIADLTDGTTVDADVRARDGEPVGWNDDGDLVVRQFVPDDRLLFIDPATGQRVGEAETSDDETLPPPVWVDRRDGRIVLERDDGLGTASFEAPDGYDVTSATTWGDEGIAFVDTVGRVAVTRLGDDAVPVLVAEDAVVFGGIVARP